MVMRAFDPRIHLFAKMDGLPGHNGVHARLQRAMPGNDDVIQLSNSHEFFLFVTRGLDPRVHPFRKSMDCRVKPGNDEEDPD